MNGRKVALVGQHLILQGIKFKSSPETQKPQQNGAEHVFHASLGPGFEPPLPSNPTKLAQNVGIGKIPNLLQQNVSNKDCHSCQAYSW